MATLRNRNINMSVLPFYESIEEQNARKWWTYGRIYPLFCKNNTNLLPFIIYTELDWHSGGGIIYTLQFQLYNSKGVFVQNLTVVANNIDKINDNGKLTLQYTGTLPMPSSLNVGQYYFRLSITDNGAPTPITNIYYSEIFTLVGDITPYIKIEWWDVKDFNTGNGTIFYETNNFKNRIFLQAELAKPDYIFEDEGVDRDGIFYPIKQISEKKFKFSFFASEYLLDVIRLIRMADYVTITADGKTYTPDSFLITPTWENEGDVASVQGEFEVGAVSKKLPTIL